MNTDVCATAIMPLAWNGGKRHMWAFTPFPWDSPFQLIWRVVVGLTLSQSLSESLLSL